MARFRIYLSDFMCRQDLVGYFQLVMGMSKNDIGCLYKIIVYFLNDRKELHRAASHVILLAIAQVRFLQKVKDQIINFPGYILYQSEVILLVADFGRKYLHPQKQIIMPIQSDHKIRKSNLVTKIDDAGKNAFATPHRRYLLSHIQIFVPERYRVVMINQFDNDFVSLLLKEHGLNLIQSGMGRDRIASGFPRSILSLKCDMICIITENANRGFFGWQFYTLKSWV